MQNKDFLQQGSLNGLLVMTIVLGVLAAGFGAVMVWALVNYNDQKNNVDSKVAIAVAEAKREQALEDEDKFAEREKEPYRRFIGPDDLGRVEFDYPKTWSVYIGKNGENGRYEAYLNPNTVPMVRPSQQFALRVIVEDRSYESILKTHETAVKRGELRSSAITASGFTGTRLDGKFSNDIEGSMVVFKVRDKTLMLATDATIFKNDFDKIILKTLSFNP
ncbi:MAG TPA: hypothetical protein VD907_04645 [Verrucomicrobiae bacterium]|nr:hypothetical protein [Verrucomicrobiae bacterium]